jgi:alkanesulfonate monooxygenase SsuD/methylene tetrahydromethanopterin reductase-like flavin-dependent oxidoreductase (luciferase family)
MDGSVRVGVYIGNQRPKGTDMRDALEEQIREVRSVRDQGWDSIWTGQHFLTDSSSQLSTIVTLTRLAHEAGDMHVGIGLLLLPLLNPVEVAENVASLDVVTGGRLILGLGIGYRQVEYDAFGVPKTEAARRFAANVRIVDELLQGKAVDADYPWCTLNGASLSVAPVQSPRLPLWIGANSDGGVRRAARMADAWLINPHAPLSTVIRQIGIFREERQKRGLPPAPTVPLFREVVCASTAEQAQDLAARFLGEKYKAYSAWGQDQVLPDGDSFDRSFDDLAGQRFIVGDPGQCLQTLLSWRQATGAGHFLFRVHYAGIPTETAADSLRLLSEEVLPELRRTGP